MRTSRLNVEQLVVSSFDAGQAAPGQMQSPSVDNPTPNTYCEVCALFTEVC